MDGNGIVCLFLLLIFCVKSLKSLPSFVDEFVHIKVHVPKEVASSHGVLHSTYPGSPQYPHTSHKVIHHYHRHRKHAKRPKVPALESLILEELDQPSEEEEPSKEETFVVKEVPTEPKVSTYDVIEETVTKPPSHVDTIEIIENKEHKKHSDDHGDAGHVDSVKIVEETKTYHQDKSKEDYASTPHVKTVEVVEETKSYASKPHDIDHDQRPRKESVKIVETSIQQHDDDDDHHKHHHSQHEYHYRTSDSDDDEHHHHHHHHHRYKTPVVETVEIVKAKKSPAYYEKEYYEDDHSGEYHPRGYHKETVEVIKQSKTSPTHHHPWEYKEITHHPKQIIEVEEQVTYTKPRKEYDYHRAGTYSTHRLYPEKPKIIIDDLPDYERPVVVYRDRLEKYEKPLTAYREEHREKILRPIRIGHYAYADPEEVVEREHYYRPHYSDHSEGYPVRSTKQYLYPRTDDRGHAYSAAEREETHGHGYGHEDYDKAKYHAAYAPESYASPSDAVVTYIAIPPISNTRYSKSHLPKASASYIPSVDSYNAKHQPSITGEKTHIDWPDALEKTHDSDGSYSGYDSYSAVHVQGVGSGGYHYPPN